LVAYIKQEFREDNLIRSVENYQVFLNEQKIRSLNVDRNALKSKIIKWFQQQSQVAYIVDMEEMYKTALPEPLKTMAVNGYNRVRSGAILIIYNPGWYHGYSQTGTTHGTWHPYDTHIPLLWYGWGVAKGSTNRTVHMEDIAATLASMLHIQMPNGCIGTTIREIAP